jgi:hypothetical protein
MPRICGSAIFTEFIAKVNELENTPQAIKVVNALLGSDYARQLMYLS